jgi:hypothetical protein
MSSLGSKNDTPLGLTVHSMPVPEELGADPQLRTRSGRWKMLMVLLVCAAPVVASYTSYYWIRPEGRRNFGTLIEPQRPLPAATATALDGKRVDLRGLKDQWLLVSVSGGACDANCANNLYFQRQLRESLGKDKDRVDWVWLVDDKAPIPDAIQPALKGATVLRVERSDLQGWLSPQDGRTLADHLYVVDPMGNWMMRFPAGISLETAPQVKRDLERLMRASAGWNTPRR